MSGRCAQEAFCFCRATVTFSRLAIIATPLKTRMLLVLRLLFYVISLLFCRFRHHGVGLLPKGLVRVAEALGGDLEMTILGVYPIFVLNPRGIPHFPLLTLVLYVAFSIPLLFFFSFLVSCRCLRYTPFRRPFFLTWSCRYLPLRPPPFRFNQPRLHRVNVPQPTTGNGTAGGARGEDEDEADPLDAFMTGLKAPSVTQARRQEEQALRVLFYRCSACVMVG